MCSAGTSSNEFSNFFWSWDLAGVAKNINTSHLSFAKIKKAMTSWAPQNISYAPVLCIPVHLDHWHPGFSQKQWCFLTMRIFLFLENSLILTLFQICIFDPSFVTTFHSVVFSNIHCIKNVKIPFLKVLL